MWSFLRGPDSVIINIGPRAVLTIVCGCPDIRVNKWFVNKQTVATLHGDISSSEGTLSPAQKTLEQINKHCSVSSSFNSLANLEKTQNSFTDIKIKLIFNQDDNIQNTDAVRLTLTLVELLLISWRLKVFMNKKSWESFQSRVACQMKLQFYSNSMAVLSVSKQS